MSYPQPSQLLAFTVLSPFTLGVLRRRKQRRKLHEHLRQSLRNKRNANTSLGPDGGCSARGHASSLPLRDLQRMNVGRRLASAPTTVLNTDATSRIHALFLALQLCNGTLVQAANNQTETSFSTAKYASSAQEATTLTCLSSQR